MDYKEMYEKVHQMVMMGEKKKDIIKWIMDEHGLSSSSAYRHFDKYLKDPSFLGDRDDLKEMFKKGLFQIYFTNVNKGYGRAAMEAADRILVACPWIKDKDDDHVDTNIKVVIEEWTKKKDDN